MSYRILLLSFLCGIIGCASNTKPANDVKVETANIALTQTEPLPLSPDGPFGLKGEGTLRATIVTNEGNLECELFEKEAPKTVRNFVLLGLGKKEWRDPTTGVIKRGQPFYTNLDFFRIIPGFFLQSGDPTQTGKSGPGYIFDDEISETVKHDRPGILSMANHGPNTNGSQFFILLKATPHLDGHHSVFGHCSNSEVLQKLASYPVNSDNVPVNPPKIIRVEFLRKSSQN